MELPTLTAAGHLWWLLVVLPVLFLLAQPPRPRRVLWTAHRAQWLLAQAALRRRPVRFRALRWLLLSLAATLCIVAVARPERRAGDGPTRLVVLLDGSASMARRCGDGSAFAAALARARSELARVPAGVDVEVVRLGGGGLQRWSGPAARALAAPGAAGGVLPAPLAVLAQDALGERGTAVLVLTDGQTAVPELPAACAVARFGTPLPNVALAAVHCTDAWPLPALHVEVEVASFADVPLSGALTATGAVAQPVSAPVELAAGERARLALDLQRTANGGDVELRLQVAGDGLPIDDAAVLSLPPLPAPRIAVAADEEGNRFARKGAEALAEAVGAEVVAPAAGATAGFLIAEGGIATLPAGSAPMITFGVAPAGAPAPPAVWPLPVVVDWAREEPLLAGLDLSELNVSHALADALPDGTPLVVGARADGTTAPLAVLVHGPVASSVHFAFRLQDSNLGLLPAFPQLLLRSFRAGYGHGKGIAPPILSPLAEADLRGDGSDTPDRPLPPFPEPARDLGPHCMLLALLLLAVRAGLR